MTYFHIRLSTNLFVKVETASHHEFNPLVIEFCKKHLCKYIIALENADLEDKRTHIHIHGESVCHKNSQSLRRAWDSFGLPTGRGNYSLKSHDNTVKKPDEKGYVYVCKGKDSFVKDPPCIMSKLGFSDDDIKELHEKYWSENKIYQDQLRKANQPEPIRCDLTLNPEVPKKKKTITWTQKLIEEINLNYPDKLWNVSLETDKVEICNLILDRMGVGGKALDEIIFKRIFFAVYNGLRKTKQDKTNFRQRFYDCVY